MFTYTTRKDGRLMKRVSVNGKIKTIYANNPKELEKLYIKEKSNDFNNICLDDSITFKQWAEKWFETYMSNREFNTQDKNRRMLDKHIYPYIGNMKLKNIKVIHIKEIQKKIIDKGLTDTSNRTISLIKRILNDAVENDLIVKNVAFNIKNIAFEKKEKHFLSSYEDKILLETAKTHKYGVFFLILRYCGLRREEAVPLTINDIDLKNKTILINKAVYFEKNQPHIKTTKNKKIRIIPIPDLIFDKVKDLVNNSNDLLFTRQTDNKMLSITAIRSMTRSFIYEMNKISDKKITFTLHELRHSYCTMLYYSGINIKKAQSLMGHSSADLIYNIYAHLDEEREDTTNQINNYINKINI